MRPKTVTDNTAFSSTKLSKLSTMSRPPLKSSFALKRRASKTFKEPNLNQPMEQIFSPVAKSSNYLAIDKNLDFPPNSSFDISFTEDTRLSRSKFARRVPEYAQTPQFGSQVVTRFPSIETSPIATKKSILLGLFGKVCWDTFWV